MKYTTKSNVFHKGYTMNYLYECVVHRINGDYKNEYYKRAKGGCLELSNEEEYFSSDSDSRDAIELHHGENYNKVKSPFNGEMLYGRYINISNRIKDEINRF